MEILSLIVIAVFILVILIVWVKTETDKKKKYLEKLEEECPVIKMFDKGYLEKLFKEKEIEFKEGFIEINCWASFKIAEIPFEIRPNFDGLYRIALDNVYMKSPSLRKLIMTKFKIAVEKHNNAYLKELGKKYIKENGKEV